MTDLLKLPIIINAAIFQILWFACVLGGANSLVWPCLVMGLLMMIWQLHPSRRHPGDLRVLVTAIALGLAIDTAWPVLGLMEFTDPRPIYPFTPMWMLVLWMGFALTLNHSMSWLSRHPALPALMGFIGGPMAYFTGQKLGAVNYLIDPWILSAILGVVWAIALTILDRIRRTHKVEHVLAS